MRYDDGLTNLTRKHNMKAKGKKVASKGEIKEMKKADMKEDKDANKKMKKAAKKMKK